MFLNHQFSVSDLKRAFGSFPTGVTVMTTRDTNGEPVGMTASSFNTVSMEPALILWSIRIDSYKRSAFANNDRFTVNILAEDQLDACYGFAKPLGQAFDLVEWEEGKTGIPRLLGAAAHLECQVWARHLAGDHEIIIGEITSLASSDVRPLVFHAGKTCQLPTLEMHKG